METKTQITCSKQDWKLLQNSRRIKDARLKNKKIEFDKDTMDIERHVLTAYNNSNPNTVDVYLSMDELKLINSIDEDLLNDRLANVRDWLLISCLTGQRISDFMNFSIDNIRHQDEFSVMDILQEKGKKSVTIPVLNEVLKIMKRYDGGFPRQLSDQKYNDYVKEVVKLAGIDEITYGGVVKIIPGKGKRKIMGDYPKYELISSHVGRRSFATNFYGKIRTPWLMNITGHVKESTFLAYIGKTSKDTAVEAAREFKKLNIEL